MVEVLVIKLNATFRNSLMMKWTFTDVTHRRREIAIESADHAVELLMEASGWDGYGVTFDFLHADKGHIGCIANTEFSSLCFSPNYDRKSRSWEGRRSAYRVKPVTREPFYFVDGVGVASSLPERYLLPILKAMRGLRHILKHHEHAPFLRWTDPLPANEELQ
jgi:hypothetical protein